MSDKIVQESLPVNRLPENQLALQWLQKAKAHPEQQLLYLTQLAFWGLQQGLRVLGKQVSPQGLEEQVNLLLVDRPNQAQEQSQVYQWLLRNPDGPPPEEQRLSLWTALNDAETPLQAATAVLETVYDRMAAASAPTPA